MTTVIATPTRDVVSLDFCGDLVKLCRRHPEARFLGMKGIYIAALRQQAVTLARQSGASHLLFLDSDMRFPVDTLDRLLAHDVNIVAANYVQRTVPEWYVARVGGRSVSSEGRTGLESVESVGCGVMLLKLSLFDHWTRPWFDTPYEGEARYLGEDTYFCELARGHGEQVWIDHDLSQDVRHQSTVEYGVGEPETVGHG